jgi:hypothetical protein
MENHMSYAQGPSTLGGASGISQGRTVGDNPVPTAAPSILEQYIQELGMILDRLANQQSNLDQIHTKLFGPTLKPAGNVGAEVPYEAGVFDSMRLRVMRINETLAESDALISQLRQL